MGNEIQRFCAPPGGPVDAHAIEQADAGRSFSSDATDLALWEQVQADLLAREAELIASPDGDTAWLPEWYLGKLAECEALRARLDEQFRKLATQIDTRQRVLETRWGGAFRQQVEKDIEADGGRKRSHDYLTGRAGWRKRQGKMVIDDKRTALPWVLEHCPEACEPTIARLTPLKEHFKQHGEEPPGCRWIPESDEFYPAMKRPELPSNVGESE